jgi:hypothetical protein
MKSSEDREREADATPMNVLVEAIASRVADLVFAKLAPLLAPVAQHPDLATAEQNPYGSPRPFLDAARRGDFPASRAGRHVVAAWPVVVAAILAKPKRTKGASVGQLARAAATRSSRQGALEPPAAGRGSPGHGRQGRDDDVEKLKDGATGRGGGRGR